MHPCLTIKDIIGKGDMGWMSLTDIRIVAEMAKIGCCSYCLLRYANSKNEALYQLEETQLIHSMFPNEYAVGNTEEQKEVQEFINSSTSVNDTMDPGIYEASLLGLTTLLEIPSPMEQQPTGTNLTHLIYLIKTSLLNRTVCVCCLDLFTPNPDFYTSIGEIVTQADYEFREITLFKTLPSNLIIRQQGVWTHLHLIYGKLVLRFANALFEGLIVELKESSRLVHNHKILQSLNTAREVHNQAVHHGFQGLIYQKTHSYSSPRDTRPINQDTIVIDRNAKFKVNIIFMTENIECENELRIFLDGGMKKFNTNRKSGQIVGNSLSVNSNLMKLLPKIDSTTLKRLKISPPQLPQKFMNESSIVHVYGTCYHPSHVVDLLKQKIDLITPQNRIGDVDDTKQTVETASDIFERNNDNITYKPKRFCSIKEDSIIVDATQSQESSIAEPIVLFSDLSNGVARGYATILSPYICAEISCQHDNILLEANYLKLSRVTSQTSWFMDPIHPHEIRKFEAKNNMNDSMTQDDTVDMEEIHEEQSYSKFDQEKTENSYEEDYDGPVAETAVDSELGFRFLPHFRPTEPGLLIKPPKYCRITDGKLALCKSIIDSYNYVPGDMIRSPDINLEQIVNASGYKFKFHSSGREDLNVRMLGNGRPMFLEFINPRRTPPLTQDWLEQLEKEVNSHTLSAKILNLRAASQEDFDKMVKGIAEKRKRYRCVVFSEQPLQGPEGLNCINELVSTSVESQRETKNMENQDISNLADNEGLEVSQLTPLRVLSRRTSMERKRFIYALSARYINEHWFYLDLETQAGTYVKEFVHSDRGRTTPSITSLLKSSCSIIQLDVVDLVL